MGDRHHDAEDVLGPVIDLVHQKSDLLLGLLVRFGAIQDALLERLVQFAQLLLDQASLGDFGGKRAVGVFQLALLEKQLGEDGTLERRIAGLIGFSR